MPCKMNQRIEKIRQLLNELEAEPENLAASDRDFSAFELPDIIQEIVDDLQPLLEPYDAAFYWYLFRHSIARDGSPYLRVSSRGLRGTVVKSARSEAAEKKISLGKVTDTLRALETIGAIRKEGDPNREGTLYRVLIPDEIQACRDFRSARAASEQEFPFPPTDNEVDCYNVKQNRIKIYERDGYVCRYCQKQLTRFTATLDHVKPVVDGGDNSLENLVTACLDCNSRKNRRTVGDFLVEQ
jgi:hypothetical protein